MGGMLRCPSCATVTWRILTLASDDRGACPTCGSPMRSERRRPGRRATALGAERRGGAATARPRALDMSRG
jgi:uncharacterized paraquat-inducible protein A